MTLRAAGSVDSNNGTFRLEVGSASADDKTRSRVDADHDGKFWTSQLGANASADEVGTSAFWVEGNTIWCVTANKSDTYFSTQRLPWNTCAVDYQSGCLANQPTFSIRPTWDYVHPNVYLVLVKYF